MLPILLNWLLVFYLGFVIGSWLRAFFVTPTIHADVAICIIWGLFGISQINTIALFFLPADVLLPPRVLIAAHHSYYQTANIHQQWKTSS